VTTFAAESQAPYDQTCLSKFVPASEIAPEEVPPLLSEHAISDPRLRIEHVEVKQRDVVTKVATLGDGREEAFDSVLVASGSIAQRPDIPGANLDGVFTLWEFSDAAGNLQSLEPADHAIMLGDSSVGLETAAAVRNCGIEVTVAAPGERHQTRLRRLIQHCTMKATIFYVWQ
jgi:apoptosis-inducing factor 3